MDVKILKTFPYSADGTKTKDTVVDDVIDIRAELVTGLVAEGYVREAVAGETSTTAVDIGDPETMGRAALIEAAVTLFRIEITNESDEGLRRGLLYRLNRDAHADLFSDLLAGDPPPDDDRPLLPPAGEGEATKGVSDVAPPPTDPAPAGAAEGAQTGAAADLWDVHYVSADGENLVYKALTREEANIRAGLLHYTPAEGEAPRPVRVEPHVAEAPKAEVVEIPADWRDLHHAKQISLAQKLNPADISTKVEAVAAIEAELAARAG
jgi:hypothetical protein